MKFSRTIALGLGCLSSLVWADELISPLPSVNLITTESHALSIQNLSPENVSIDIYGDVIELVPASGIQYQCQGYAYLELQILNNEHDYFEVPCQSTVIFENEFKNQSKQGE